MSALRFGCFLLIFAFAAASAGTLVQRTPSKASAKQNPFEGSPAAERAGGKLYLQHCGSCHGQTREGRDRTPPLARSDIYQAPPGALFWILTNGSLRRGMPPFAHLPAEQRWQIVTFLRRTEAPELRIQERRESTLRRGSFLRAPCGSTD